MVLLGSGLWAEVQGPAALGMGGIDQAARHEQMMVVAHAKENPAPAADAPVCSLTF